jgi:hypothetical protein
LWRAGTVQERRTGGAVSEPPAQGPLQYLNYELLESFDPGAFQATSPYPFLNPQGTLTPEGYRRLLDTMPTLDVMQPFFGVKRKHGQEAHDRYTLEYDRHSRVSDDWHAFIAELRGPRYGEWVRAMFGRRMLRFNFHWHYAPAGASVSPHCDSPRKLGSHIFYLNEEPDWDPAWGGETVVLDDGGRFSNKSAPRWEDFPPGTPAQTMGNRSFLFARRGNSWHGVRAIHCPEGKYRKVFIVVVNDVVLSTFHEAKVRITGRAATY